MKHQVQLTLCLEESSYSAYLLFSEIEFFSITLTPTQNPINAQISGSIGAFLSLYLNRTPRAAMNKGLLCEGDPQTLIVLEEWLTLMPFNKKIRQVLETCFKDMTDYYTYDALLWAPKALAERFFTKTDDLRSKVDRLEARLQQVLQKAHCEHYP